MHNINMRAEGEPEPGRTVKLRGLKSPSYYKEIIKTKKREGKKILKEEKRVVKKRMKIVAEYWNAEKKYEAAKAKNSSKRKHHRKK